METTASNFPGYFTTSAGNDALTEVAAEGVCDLRRDVAKSEADIKQMLGTEFCAVNKHIGDTACENIKNQADIAHRSTIHLNGVERDLQNRILENRAILTKEIGDKHDRLKDQLYSFERVSAERFCKVEMDIKDSERRILDRLTTDKLDEKNDEIAALRAEKYHDKFAYQFGIQNLELASLKQSIGSIEQNQRFSSKTVQFGTGNLAGTAQTANQG